MDQTDVNPALKYAERTAEGWSLARTITSSARLVANWADVPSVVRLRDNTLVAHWLDGEDPAADAYDVKLAWSRDDGKTWSSPVSPHHDGTETPHGFASIFELPAGGFGIVWLDGRDQKESATGDYEGDMTVRARSYAADGTEQGEVVVNKRTCECCQTAAATTSDGPIIAFRNRAGDEVRDIYVSHLAGGGWSPATAVHQDGWRISGCPINGPAISARGRSVVVAWFTVQDGQGRAFAAFSTDAGQSFGAPIRVDDVASLGRVDVRLLTDDSAAVSWIEFADQHARFNVRRVDRSGARSNPTTISGIGADRMSGFPRMSFHDGELLFAWTDSSKGLRVQTASARVN
jgi:hypothetical protein